jgi:hypothetical protein
MKARELMLFRNLIAICRENNKSSWNLQNDFILKQVIHVVTYVLYKIEDFLPVVV